MSWVVKSMDKLLIEYPNPLSYDHCSMLREEAYRQFLFCLVFIQDNDTLLAHYYSKKLEVYKRMCQGFEVTETEGK